MTICLNRRKNKGIEWVNNLQYLKDANALGSKFVLSPDYVVFQTGTYSYDEKGRLSETSYDGYHTELTYDEANRLNGYTLSYNGLDIVNQTYVYKTYTKNGVTYTTNQLSKIENPLSYGTNTCYENEYDANGYVTSVSYNGNIYAYTYDSVGRLTSETVNGTTKNYTYDNKNNIQKRA